MNILIDIIGITCLGMILSTVIAPQLKLKTKPFNCESCTSFWLGLGYFSTLGIYAILPASICYVLAYKIYRL